MIVRPFSLRRRIIASFLALTAMVCLLFGLFSFIFAYTVEDSLFAQALREETARQQAHWADHRALDRPARDYIALYREPTDFPADLRRQYGTEPGRREFAGDDGRHYHVERFDLPGRDGPAYAVAEVSRYLVVRPIRGEMLLFLGIGTGIILCLAMGVGYWLADKATKPLTRLAARVAESGPDPIPRLSASEFPANEIGLLARALEQAFERIAAFVERESRFTREASHELRTPLAVIKSAAELIAAQPGSVAAGPLGRIVDAAREMERTIDLLLSLAQEENARAEAEDMHLLPLIESAVLRAGELYCEADSRVSIAVPDGQRIRANRGAAAAILGNLIGNAFQHSRGGMIDINMDGGDLIIGDNGVGLPSNVSAALFEPFAKGEASGGHGLGLSIVRRLCDANGIGLRIVSAVNGGTRIRLGFPPAEG
jgi:signal transduction histidine kinase